MALLAAQQVTATGLNPVFTAASASDTVAADDRVIVVYRNTNASIRTVAIVTPTKLNRFGQSLPDVQKTLGATNGQQELGPLTQDFADPATGLVTVTTSATTDVTVAAIRF